MPVGTLTFRQSFGPLAGLAAITRIAADDDHVVYADTTIDPTLRVVFSLGSTTPGTASGFAITNGDGTVTYATGDYEVSLTALDAALEPLDPEGMFAALFANLSVIALAEGATVDLAPLKDGLTLEGNDLGTEFLLGHYSATVNAGDGDDLLTVTASSPAGSINGGDGDDTLVLSGPFDSVMVSLVFGTIGFSGGEEWQVGGIEFYRGSSGTDFFSTIGDGTRFEGGAGGDFFIRPWDSPEFADTIDYSLEGGSGGIAVILEIGGFNLDDPAFPPDLAAALHDLFGDDPIFAGKTRDTFGAIDDVPSGYVVVGTARSDVYYGYYGADVFNAGDGDDDIFGGDGDDTIDGGGGDHDTFYLSQAKDTYAEGDITYADGVFTIVSAGGTDTVTGIEHFAFADVTVDASDYMPPAANDDAGEVTEAATGIAGDATAGGNVLDNDDNPSEVDGIRVGSSGVYTIVGTGTVVVGTFGSLSISRTGEWTYTLDDLDPETSALAGGATAHDTFSYRIDGALGDVATIDVVVSGSNDAPVATADSVVTDEDTALSFAASTLTGNDSDAEGSALTVTSVQAASNGTAQLSAGNVTFTPTANFHGTASFTYTVEDSQGRSATQQVTVTVDSVNDAPSGADGRVAVREDGNVALSAATFGFTDGADGDELSSVIVTALPTKGVLKLGATDVAVGQEIALAQLSALTWTPPPGESGTGLASLDFRVRDDGGTAHGGVDTDVSTRSIVFDVTPVNDAPDGEGAALIVQEDGVLTFSAADFGFSDSDGHELLAVLITAVPTIGTLTLGGTAVAPNQEISAAALSGLRWTPPAGQSGAGLASIGFKVRDTGGTVDGGADTDPTAGTISMSVLPVNDPPNGTSSTITIAEDTVRAFAPGDFGFSDSDGGSLSAVVVVSLPESGALKLGAAAVTEGQVIPVAQIGSLTWTPPANATGSGLASFSFKVRDDGGTANGGVDTDPTARTIVFDVTPASDAPVSVDRAVTLVEDDSYAFAASDFAFTDADPGNVLKSVTIVSLPGGGTLALAGVPVVAGQSVAAGLLSQLVFTPGVNANGSPLTSFGFKVSDGTLESGARTITIIVVAVNDAPVARDDSAFATDEDTAITIPPAALLGNDSDPEASSLIIDSVGDATGGQVTLNTDGSVTFVPLANFSGSGQFSYTVRDGHGVVSGPAVVTVAVAPVNDAPVFVRDGGVGPRSVLTVMEGRSDVYEPVASDVDNATLTYGLEGPDAALFVFADGAVRFAAAPDFETPADNGRDNVYNFSVVASDGNLADTESVTVTIRDVVGNSVRGTNKGERIDLANKVGGKGATSEQDLVDGRNGADTIAGASGDDTLKGGAGDDSLSGGDDDDRLQGGAGRDTLDGGGGTDIADYTGTATTILLTLNAGGASARIGGVVEDWVVDVEGITGGKGNDLLAGDKRANILDGSLGNDTLTGGGGRDKFVFATKIKSGNVDVIADFKPGTDRIVLDDAIFKAIGSGLSPGAFYSKAGATKAHDADDRIIYDRTSGKLFYDDDGNRSGGHAPVHFATLGSRLTLDVDDFVIV